MLVTVYEVKKSVDGKQKWVYFDHEKAVNGKGGIAKTLEGLKRKYRVHHQWILEGGTVIQDAVAE
jgi:hypothetical protein